MPSAHGPPQLLSHSSVLAESSVNAHNNVPHRGHRGMLHRGIPPVFDLTAATSLVEKRGEEGGRVRTAACSLRARVAWRAKFTDAGSRAAASNGDAGTEGRSRYLSGHPWQEFGQVTGQLASAGLHPERSATILPNAAVMRCTGEEDRAWLIESSRTQACGRLGRSSRGHSCIQPFLRSPETVPQLMPHPLRGAV